MENPTIFAQEIHLQISGGFSIAMLVFQGVLYIVYTCIYQKLNLKYWFTYRPTNQQTPKNRTRNLIWQGLP